MPNAKFIAFLLIAISIPTLAQSKENPIPLWTGDAPGAQGTDSKDIPEITSWLPENPNGTAIIILPGGGYGHLADDHEGKQIAQWCNDNGIAGFVVQYRIAPDYHHPAPIIDASRAIRTVRARAEEWNIDPDKIGIIGFSAGGHLAATTATQFDLGEGKSTDHIQRQSSRPDFVILGYPVITMTDLCTHMGSRRNLLGDNPSEAMIQKMSAENNVTPNTPPTFLFHTTEDKAVAAENSILFYSALLENNVPAEIHIYEKGRHGLGLAKDKPAMSAWPEQCITWLKGQDFLE